MTHREAINRLNDLIIYSSESAAGSVEPEIWLGDIPALEMAIEKLEEDMYDECKSCTRESRESESPCATCPHRY